MDNYKATINNPEAAHAIQTDSQVDSQFASLIDALNSFDSDDAEIGGNLAIPPKLEEYYY